MKDLDKPAFPLVMTDQATYGVDGMTLGQYAAIHIAAGVEASLTGGAAISDDAFAEYVWRRVRALFGETHDNKEG